VTSPGWILVVDDDQDVRDVIATLLELNGYVVVGAEDGLAGLRAIRERGRPAGVLLDLRMPRMNGAEFARALREDSALATIPIVVLSGDLRAIGTDDVPEAADCLKKPCDLDHLLGVVRRAFGAAPPRHG
jgi:CheY-like chemotaxis protein